MCFRFYFKKQQFVAGEGSRGARARDGRTRVTGAGAVPAQARRAQGGVRVLMPTLKNS